MSNSRAILGFIMLFCFYQMQSQPYGNEWINLNQEYLKLKVAEEGLYRLTTQELVDAGFPFGAVHHDRIRMFRRGEEVALLIGNGTPEGSFDFLEFYAKNNDGKSDRDLYRDPSYQPHQYYNLFTDSAAYFLTWTAGGQNGSRISFSADNDRTGLDPEAYHDKQEIKLESSLYALGMRYGSQSTAIASEYDLGEGWTGPVITTNQSRTFEFTAESSVVEGENPLIELVMIGQNKNEHRIEVLVGPNTGSLRTLDHVAFSDRTSVTFNQAIEWSDLGPNGELAIRCIPRGVGAADAVSISYVIFRYASEFNMNEPQSKFELKANPIDRSFLRVMADDAASVRLFDITNELNPILINQENLPTFLEAVVLNTEEERSILAITGYKSISALEQIEFQPINTGNDYFIISHNDLRDSPDPVQAYAGYRASDQGGNFNVSIKDIDELYNQFSFGDPSPLALRNFFKLLYNEANPEYVFIIGKATSIDFNIHRIAKESLPDDESLVHFVPTYGSPGSDWLFSAGFDGTILPAIPTGRLTVRNQGDIEAYLDKVIEHEALNYDQLWRKNLVQLSGGQNANELTIFRGYIDDLQRIAEGDFLGGKAFNKGKSTSDPVETINIVEQVNNGLAMITFFGHSGAAVTDIEIGDAGSPDFNNKGKYPAMLINGCNAGDVFSQLVSFGEDWISEPDRGAIVFMAHSDLARSSNLKVFSDIFYSTAFANESYIGESIGNIVIESSRRYISQYGDSEINRAQIYQLILQGDPAIKVFGAQLPDYEILDENVFAIPIESDRILSNQEAFELNLIVKNYGRSVLDSLEVEVTRLLPNGESLIYREKFERVLRWDTLEMIITNDFTKDLVGLNEFTIRIDPDNVTAELNEANNQSNFSISFNSGNNRLLIPGNYSIVDHTSVEFVWQSIDPLEHLRDYQFQIDTTETFNSSFRKEFIISGETLLSYIHNFNALPAGDTTVIYWRVRFANPGVNEDTSYVVQSFALITGGETGWGQFNSSQFQNGELIGSEFSVSGDLELLETTTPVEIFTFGTESPFNDTTALKVIVDGVNLLQTNALLDPYCNQKTINLIAFDRETAQTYRPLSFTQGDVLNNVICGRLPQQIFNLTEDMVLNDRYIEQFINNLNFGDKVIIFTMDEVVFSNWDAAVISALNDVGILSNTITSLIDGQSVIFVGEKGASPGEALEIVTDYTAVPLLQQTSLFNGDITGQFLEGSLVSKRIGPAVVWNNIDYRITNEPSDNFQIEILQLDKNGNEIPFIPFGRAEINIDEIDATTFPFLKLKYTFSDLINFTVPQIDYWSVHYIEAPEGVLLMKDKNKVVLQEGEIFQKDFEFKNITSTNFSDSVDVVVQLQNTLSGTIENHSYVINGPQANDSSYFTISFDTRGKTGNYNFSIGANSREPEQNSSNNVINYLSLITVKEDEINPVLDITFDGFYILNGDIVSSDPLVVIRLKDNNDILLKDDTTGFDVQLKAPCEGCDFKKVSFTDPKVTWFEASEDQDFSIEYKPGPLEDGVYHLKVQGSDESGNLVAINPFEVSFEVIGKSTITHFYPYPNPFSTSTRFVFTLTGSDLPDDLKIQILTISGRIVREIMIDEIGPLKIGNNITQYAWDGRDDFGNKLANGVYIYRVLSRIGGKEIKHRGTSADGAFKNGYGKLYILR